MTRTRRRDAAASGSPAKDARLIRGAPLAVWALVVLNGLLITCWSVLTPTYHAPDEPTHADAVMRLAEGYGWGHVDRTHLTKQGAAAEAASPYGTLAQPHRLNHDPVPASRAVARSDRADWADLVEPHPRVPPTVQQMTQHPPGYYYVEAAVIKLFGGAHQRWDRAVGLMRLVSMLMIAPLPLLAWAVAFRLSDDRRAGIAAAVFPLVVPELTHMGGVVNNDNALTLTGGLVLVGVACVLRGDRRLRTAAYVGITLGLALFTKGLALVLPPLVLAAYVIAWLSERRRTDAAERPPLWRTLGAPVGLVAVLSFAFGGWWWFANIINYGRVQPSAPSFARGAFLGDDLGSLVDIATRSMAQRWWGALGWFEVQLPMHWVYVATVLAFLCLVLALTRRSPRGSRLGILAMMWPTVAVYGMLCSATFSYYFSTHYYRGLSGRYLFVGIVGVAAIVGMGATRFAPLRRWAPLALLVGGLLLQQKEVRLSILVWWRPRGGTLGQAWDALLTWAPWSPFLIKALLVVTAAALVAVVAELLRTALRPDVDETDDQAFPGAEPPRSRVLQDAEQTGSAA